uniref:DNA-binding response regulator n=1 Tax=Muribaculaceae bacterium Z82 TaxID=2304548 RepID=A0A7C9JDR8_9BACT
MSDSGEDGDTVTETDRAGTDSARAAEPDAEATHEERSRWPRGSFFVPLAFLGLGVYRAWIEIVFVGSFTSFPAAFGGVAGLSVRDLFDWSMVATAIFCTLLARKISPFFNKPFLFAFGGLLLVTSTVLMFASCWVPDITSLAKVPAAVLGGVGIALVILVWSELYSCLNPLRVALYYSASIVVGALIIYVYRGFYLPWLFALTALLPVISLIAAWRGFESLPAPELPSVTWMRFSVPWKAVLFMAAYAFGYGLMEGGMYEGAFGPHSAPGTVAVAALVFIGVALRGGRFDFSIIYRVALPLVVVAFTLVPLFGNVQGAAASFCMAGAYTAQSIIIMLIMANICYRFGVSAIWLFGIERSVRQIAMWLGRTTADVAESANLLGDGGGAAVSLLAVLAVVVATTILLSERDLSSRWGANFLSGGMDSAAAIRKQELADRCAEISRQYKLSAREEEVLLLLAQHKTVGIIERELLIANGTAKAHVRHIYQKLNIHTRNELFDLLGADPRP